MVYFKMEQEADIASFFMYTIGKAGWRTFILLGRYKNRDNCLQSAKSMPLKLKNHLADRYKDALCDFSS